jgi:ribosome-interacting GTPase 1
LLVCAFACTQIQLLDLPGIIEGAKDGKGRGRQVISTARTCDVIVIVLDAVKPLTHRKLIEHELEGFGIRLNKKPPAITFNKKDKGGIAFTPNPNGETTFLDEETVKNILAEYKIHNADVKLHADCTDEDLIDVIEGNRIYTPAVYAVNKMDSVSVEELRLLEDMKNYVPCSSEKEWNLDGLLEKIWDALELVRVYTMPRGVTPNFDEPIILHKSASTVEDFCNKLHKTIMRSFKHAMVWGMSAKHRPQRVGKEHVLHDEDVVQIVKAH